MGLVLVYEAFKEQKKNEDLSLPGALYGACYLCQTGKSNKDLGALNGANLRQRLANICPNVVHKTKIDSCLLIERSASDKDWILFVRMLHNGRRLVSACRNVLLQTKSD